MSNTQANQAFYSLTLEASSAAAAACMCSVIPGLKAAEQQIFEARGERLYLRRLIPNPDGTVQKLETLAEQDVFSIVRGVGAFRIPGTKEGMFPRCSLAEMHSDGAFAHSATREPTVATMSEGDFPK